MARVETLTIGDELVEGRLIDTNASTIADALARAGLTVVRQVTVGDSIEEIVDAIRLSAGRSQALLVTGGLGPTKDDLTSQAVAEALGRPLVRAPEALAHLDSIFASRGRQMSPNNAKQADLPAQATIIPNPRGTAVGFSVDAGQCRIWVMPGVPHEMLGMLHEVVLPDMMTRLPCHRPLLATLKSFGLPESEVGQRLEDLSSQVVEPARLWIQYRATFPEIHVRLVLHNGREEELGALLATARERLGRHVFASGKGEPEVELAEVVAKRLRRHQTQIGLGDAMCGGLPAQLLAQTPDGVEVLGGALVCTSRSALARLAGVADDTSATGLAEAVAAHLGTSSGAVVVPGADGSVELAVVRPGGDGTASRERMPSLGRVPSFERVLRLPFDPPRLRTFSAYALLELMLRTLDHLDQTEHCES